MIDRFAAWLVYGLFGLDPESRLGSSVHFFFYDTTKILLLLFLISILMGIINAYFPIGRLRHFLTTRRRFRLERYLSPWVRTLQANSDEQTEAWERQRTSLAKRLPAIARDALGIVRGVLLYVLIGIGIGAAIHGYVPEGFFTRYLASSNLLAVPLAVLCAVPMYANAAGIVPVIQVFVAKGVPLGTAIAFMMAVVGLSLPEATMLKKVMTWKLIGIFFGTVTLFIILSGYLFNLIL